MFKWFWLAVVGALAVAGCCPCAHALDLTDLTKGALVVRPVVVPIADGHGDRDRDHKDGRHYDRGLEFGLGLHDYKPAPRYYYPPPFYAPPPPSYPYYVYPPYPGALPRYYDPYPRQPHGDYFYFKYRR